MFMILSFWDYFDLLLVLYKFLEPNVRFTFEMESGVSESNVCDNIMGLMNHQSRSQWLRSLRRWSTVARLL
jgi:hypothetical protein